ncbi:hypothetical protein FNV43_RR05130 [Rhamnella rubrinervis]|uniref:Scarecrow-like protein 14 n=1 Tax=Rhamnella rubrinervis TaxID=2594499 RepID=A0A8K0HKV3_9ROSA|nr:hypothetical protein FNV43_RR05130 [Rhamnella rubrinervis]
MSELHTNSYPTSDFISETDSPESRDLSNAILKYISEMLMEEDDLKDKPCMLQHCLALQAAEKSFYDVIGKKYGPPSFDHSPLDLNQTSGNTTTSSWVSDQREFESSLIESPEDSLLVPDSSAKTLSIEPMTKGSRKEVEVIDPESNPPLPIRGTGKYNSLNGSKGKKKNHQREEGDDLGGRSNKQLAAYDDHFVPPEMYDNVLLSHSGNHKSEPLALHDNEKVGEKEKLQSYKHKKGSDGKNSRRKKRDKSKEVIVLWPLLNQCAEAVASYDQKTANHLLKQIRQTSSPYGDETQRLAHYFANALEARLTGGTPLHITLGSASDLLTAYQVYLTACPFKKMADFFANRTISKLAEKASRLHIIDFGILYGYQWPCLIQDLSERTGGPPMLRVTGIELPQPGFRPSGRVEETGRRLANYCKRFNIPFEFNVMAQKWETIQYEDLKMDRDEFIAVNCSFRMKHIPDETVLEDCPRDTVLKLIRRINPDIFIHGVVNGKYNSPFFLRRFWEALHHFSASFDMFEATLHREDQHRLLFEEEVFGKHIMNVIACEGLQRFERPETYKQWQFRNTRAGFRQLPLDQEILKEVKNMVRLEYHKDFIVDEDGMWLLQGWKGRIMEAISCWKPA